MDAIEVRESRCAAAIMSVGDSALTTGEMIAIMGRRKLSCYDRGSGAMQMSSGRLTSVKYLLLGVIVLIARDPRDLQLVNFPRAKLPH